MSDWARDADSQNRRARLRRRRRWENRLVNLYAGLIVAAGVFAAIIAISLLGSLAVYVGWNLGVYNLAHAVHTSVTHISLWSAFGTSFAIGVLARIFRHGGAVQFKRDS